MSRKPLADGDCFAIFEKDSNFWLTGKVVASKGFSILKVQIFKDKGTDIFVSALPLENLLNFNMPILPCGIKAKSIKMEFRLVFKTQSDLIRSIFEVIY